ncbi:MAG TPA: hypothetical protein VK464_11250 [Symbiobacteriaceae bacterium]|nr:hypothetical protein [Symbiobacteriaceae bacterium]
MDAGVVSVFVTAALLPGGVSYLVRDERRKAILVVGLVWSLLAFLSGGLVCASPRDQEPGGLVVLILVVGLIVIPLLTAPRPGRWWRGLAHLAAALLAGVGLGLGALGMALRCHPIRLF